MQDTPGQENACNRYAHFAFVMRYTTLDLPTREELDGWLAADLKRSCGAGAGRGEEVRRQRMDAKGVYMLGSEYALLAASQHLAFPSGVVGDEQAPYRFFGEAGPGDPHARLRASYALARQSAQDGYAQSIDISPATHTYNGTVQAEFVARLEADPYFRYTYGSERSVAPDGHPIYRVPRDIRDRALRIEQAVCGSVTVDATHGFGDDFVNAIFTTGTSIVPYTPDLVDAP